MRRKKHALFVKDLFGWGETPELSFSLISVSGLFGLIWLYRIWQKQIEVQKPFIPDTEKKHALYTTNWRPRKTSKKGNSCGKNKLTTVCFNVDALLFTQQHQCPTVFTFQISSFQIKRLFKKSQLHVSKKEENNHRIALNLYYLMKERYNLIKPTIRFKRKTRVQINMIMFAMRFRTLKIASLLDFYVMEKFNMGTNI